MEGKKRAENMYLQNQLLSLVPNPRYKCYLHIGLVVRFFLLEWFYIHPEMINKRCSGIIHLKE